LLIWPASVFSAEWDGVAGVPANTSGPEASSLYSESESVAQMFDPSQMPEPTAVIDFDDMVHHQCVNVYYLDQGIQFERDDGFCVHAYDYAASPRITTSPPMVLATTSGPGAPTYLPHINLLFSEDTYAVGAFFGNDEQAGEVWTLEVFDANDVAVGAVTVVANGNLHVDQYLGLASGIPFRRARVDHPIIWRSAVLDDVAFVFNQPPGEIDIDIKPWSDPNSINPFSRGVIPVAILTTEDFDALTVDADSVLFGPAEAEKRHKRAHVEDVDGDGDLDLLLHFRTRDTGIAPGDTEACVTGQTYDGVPIMGCDSVRTVPPN
jgi:hypothetical protein